MGEVRIRVSLANAADDSWAHRVRIHSDEVGREEVEALVDTGAVNCVLPPFVADKLGLERPLRQMAEYGDGRHQEVDVTEPVRFELQGRKVYEECLVLGDDVLIGRTALGKTDLHVDCRSRKILPNPAHPHQPVVKVKYGGRQPAFDVV